MKASSSPAWLQRKAIFLILITTSVLASCASPAPVGSGPWLLDSLQRLADDGSLFEPDRVARVLDLQIAPATPEELYDQPPACEKPDTRRSLIVSRYRSAPTWLRSTPEGIKGMVVPGVAINRGGISGDPSFTYDETTRRTCNDRYDHLAPDRKATLTIAALPAFVCYQRQELEQRFGKREELATDGVSLVRYAVNNHDDRSTSLTFTFTYGAPCALSVYLRQGVEQSRRYERAYSKRQQCFIDSKTLAARENAADACGSVTDFYIREPD